MSLSPRIIIAGFLLLYDILAVAHGCPIECQCIYTGRALDLVEVSCNLKQLRSIPRLGPDTVTLDLSSNKLLKVPAGVFPLLRKLKSLWLDNNRIKTIEAYSFRGLKDMEVISIRNNKELEQLGKQAFSGIRNLQSLLLNDNNIQWIDRHCFQDTVNIGMLSLYGNPIKELLPGSFEHLTGVGYLQLSGLTSVRPGAFNGLSHVHELSLEDLILPGLDPRTFAGLNDIATLKIHHSSIKVVEPEAFSGLRNINTLLISNSKIHHLSAGAFDNMDNATKIYFIQNEFEKIEREFPSGLEHKADVIVFESNDADCCHLDLGNLQEWKAEGNATSNSVVGEFLRGIICGRNKYLKHQNLYRVDVRKVELACNGHYERQEAKVIEERQKEKPNITELYRMSVKGINRGSAVRDLNQAVVWVAIAFFFCCLHLAS